MDSVDGSLDPMNHQEVLKEMKARLGKDEGLQRVIRDEQLTEDVVLQLIHDDKHDVPKAVLYLFELATKSVERVEHRQ